MAQTRLFSRHGAKLSRRAYLALLAGSTLGVARAASADTPTSELLEQFDLRLDGREAKRCLLLVPKKRKAKVPLLILLHGLGEADDERLGIHAWGERYGLVKAYERLTHPPLERTLPKLGYIATERLERLNRSLSRRAFQDLAIACPVTPKPWAGADVVPRYADWLFEVLLPRVQEHVSVGPVGVDGCSMGGKVALEVFLSGPHRFRSFGMVQGAIKRTRAEFHARRLAEAIERTGAIPMHFLTAQFDVYRKAHEQLSAELSRLGVPHVLEVPPGHHNQPWLREIGSVLTLLWHSRMLNAQV